MTMSDALIGCQPRIDEPSNARPSSNRPASRRVAGIVVCCHTPGKSMNFRSTYLTLCFCASSMASLAVMFPPQTFLDASRLPARNRDAVTFFLVSFDRDGLARTIVSRHRRLAGHEHGFRLFFAGASEVDRAVDAPERADAECNVGLLHAHAAHGKRPHEIEDHAREVCDQPEDRHDHVLEAVEHVVLAKGHDADD